MTVVTMEGTDVLSVSCRSQLREECVILRLEERKGLCHLHDGSAGLQQQQHMLTNFSNWESSGDVKPINEKYLKHC